MKHYKDYKEYKEKQRGKIKNNIRYKKYIFEDEILTIYQNRVRVSEYQDNKNIRMMFTSKNCGIMREAINPTSEEFNDILKTYLEIEKEYSNPIKKVKRLVKKIGR